MRRWLLLSLSILACPIPLLSQTSHVTRVILVRHAEKRTDEPLDVNPHLTPEGWARARALYPVAKRNHVNAIIVTQLRRTQETASVTADSLGLKPVVVRTRGAGDDNAARVAELVRTRYAGQTVLVVGHQTTIPRIIRALGGPALGDLCRHAYSHVFVLELRRGHPPVLSRSRYGGADQPDEADCVDGLEQKK